MRVDIVIAGYAPVIFLILFLFGIIGLLYRIGSAVIEQTEFLKSSDEVDNIGNS